MIKDRQHNKCLRTTLQQREFERMWNNAFPQDRRKNYLWLVEPVLEVEEVKDLFGNTNQGKRHK